MSLGNAIRIIPRKILADDRGWFLKLIEGREEFFPPGPVEIYAVSAMPGNIRGNHYHQDTAEWFCVVQGKGEVAMVDVATGERQEMVVDSADPRTIFVPAGIAHAFRNPASANLPLLVVAVASRPFDPQDTKPFPVYPAPGI